jgi:diguanylate cyclase (GGDEF)-like protein
MDYGTYFFTNIVSVTVLTLSVSLLAWHNRKVAGMQWFAAAMVVGWFKLLFQGLDGKIPTALSGMAANELYLLSFTMQMIGLHWFVTRKSLRDKWILLALFAVLATYSALFLCKIPYASNLTNISFLIVCVASAWILLTHDDPPFNAVARVAAAILIADFLVAAYRAILTNLRYMRPWEIVEARRDPHWIYSLAAMAFLAVCMAMCFIWFLVIELERELAEQARTDSLTGALNRRAMEEAALRETARSIRYGTPLCMIVLDVDHFKRINDSLGHAAGDAVLKALVRQIRSMLRANDLIARTGGEEFTILLPDTPTITGVVAAERVRTAIEALEIVYDSQTIRVTVSAGVAQLDPASGGWEAMMRRADSAMYQAKGRRNTVESNVASLRAPSSDLSTLEPSTDT